MSSKFYSKLSYSIGNEDWKTEIKALAIQPNDRILSITASGDRPLNLLTMPCKEIVCVDANPVQTALFDLKKAALQELEFDQYHAFLGLSPCKERLHTFRRLEKHLSTSSLELWNKHRKKIERGVLYQGAVERLLTIVAPIMHLLFGKKIDKLFSFSSLEEQAAYVEKAWNKKVWKKICNVCLHPTFTRTFIKDPGLFNNLGFSPSTYVHDKIYSAFRSIPLKESVLASLLFYGKVFEEGYSPYLTREGTKKIKHQLPKATFHTDNIISYLESAPDESFDCFSLSDIASYMGKEDFEKLCREIYRTAKPNARFCIRQFLSNHQLPNELLPHFIRDAALETSLEKEDRCFIYRFLAGSIHKGKTTPL